MEVANRQVLEARVVSPASVASLVVQHSPSHRAVLVAVSGEAVVSAQQTRTRYSSKYFAQALLSIEILTQVRPDQYLAWAA